MAGMIVSMKILKKKDYSSAFELTMALSFMAYLGSFANQLTYVEIAISANVNEATGAIGVVTELGIEVEDEENEVGNGDGDLGGEDRGNRRGSIIRNRSRVGGG